MVTGTVRGSGRQVGTGNSDCGDKVKQILNGGDGSEHTEVRTAGVGLAVPDVN